MRYRTYKCSLCRHAWDVIGDPGELGALDGLVGKNPACLTNPCIGRLREEYGMSVLDTGYTKKEIPYQSFVRAALGFGTPSGVAAPIAKVKTLLLSKRIVQVDGYRTGNPERAILRRLVLEDGTRLHFDVSSQGACCYFVEDSGPTCFEVVDDSQADCVDDRSFSDTNREEAGRGPSASHSHIAEGKLFDFSYPPAPKLPNTECVSSVPEKG